jgi:hypothetical protein
MYGLRRHFVKVLALSQILSWVCVPYLILLKLCLVVIQFCHLMKIIKKIENFIIFVSEHD